MYIVGTVLAVAAIICSVLVFAAPEIRGMQASSVVCACLAAVIIAATTVHRAVQNVGRDVATVAYEVGRGLAFAERAIGMTHRITDLLGHLVTSNMDDDVKGKLLELEAAVNQAKADIDAEVDRARSEGYVAGVRQRLSGEGGTVVAWPGHN